MIHVVVAEITAKGEVKMNDVPENGTNTQPSAPSAEPTEPRKVLPPNQNTLEGGPAHSSPVERSRLVGGAESAADRHV